MKTGKPSAAPNWLDIEAAVEAFEQAHAAGAADPVAFCPPPGDPLHIPVATELVRADLEFTARAGRPIRLEVYRKKFPALFADPAALAAVAYEEFRLRREAGERITPGEYKTAYGIDTSRWPNVNGSMLAASTDRPSTGCLGVTHLIADLPAEAQAAAVNAGLEAGHYPEPGAEVAGFRLVRELGRGAFARVYLAEQVDLAGRFVALKLSTKLVAEAQTLARLQHTNIVPVYSVHRAGRFHAVCMPYLGSATLADVLNKLRDHGSVPLTAEGLISTLTNRRSGSTLPPSTDPPSDASQPVPVTAPAFTGPLDTLRERTHVAAVLWIGAELADGLAHAHDRGVVHRDLKPANVLLSDEGRPMLLDFNLAGDTHRTDKANGLIGGTPSHMAPEQLATMAGQPTVVDARSDIYSLGLILYELLTGHPPHPTPAGLFREQIAQLRVARSTPPPPARSLNPAVTPAVDAILARCLAPNPADRYPSARHVAEDIRLHLEDRPLRHTREPSVVERLRKKLRRNPWVRSVPVLAGIFTLTIGLGVAGYLYRERQLSRQLEAADAVETYRAFRDQATFARFRLYAPDPDPRQRNTGVHAAKSALAHYGLPDDTDWVMKPRFAHLDPEAQRTVRSQAGELLVHLARMDVLRSSEVEPNNRSQVLADATRWCELAERVYPDSAGQQVARGYAAAIRELAAGGRPRQQPDSSIPLYLRVGDHIIRHEYRQAVTLLREADRTSAQEPVYWELLGRCYDELGDYPNAIAAYTAGIALQPQENDRLYLGRGNVHLRVRDFPSAVADFDMAIRLRPEDPVLYRDRSQARLGLGDYKGAISDLNQAEKLDPGHTRVYFMRSRVHARDGDPAAAKRELTEGLKRVPGDELSWIARAQARRPRDPTGALADLDQALKHNQRSRNALQTKASILSEDLGRAADAVAVLDALIDAHPDYIPARAGRAVVLARLGRREAAHLDATTVLKMNPTPFTRYQIAGVYALTSKTHPQDKADALRLLASALRDKEGLAYVANDHDLDPIRADPVFRELVEAAKSLEAASVPTIGKK